MKKKNEYAQLDGLGYMKKKIEKEIETRKIYILYQNKRKIMKNSSRIINV